MMPVEAVCLYCPQDMHFMCSEDGECCCSKQASLNLDTKKPKTKTVKEKGTVGAPIKTENFKDLLSTGRKRAAKLYAIQPGQVCAWAWKKNCGGGVYPIVGCSGRPAKNIHHGPDKSVLNNSPSNVSVICEYCHNLWHAANDPTYEGERRSDGSAWLPAGEFQGLEDIEDATPQEIMLSEIHYKRPVDPRVFEARMR